MTSNQIAYWTNEERKRSNLAQENLTRRDLTNRERNTEIAQFNAHTQRLGLGTELGANVLGDILKIVTKVLL